MLKYAIVLFLSLESIASIDMKLMGAIAKVESNCGKYIVGDDGKSLGAFQVQIATARDYGFTGTRDQLKDPVINFVYAHLHLRKMLDKTGNINAALWAYNAGLKRFRIGKPYHKAKYVRKVLRAISDDSWCRTYSPDPFSLKIGLN